MSRHPSLPRWLAALALTAGGLSPALLGCPGTLDDPSRFQLVPTCDPLTETCTTTTTTMPPDLYTTAEVQQEIFTQVSKCAACHGPGAGPAFGSLDLSGMPSMLEDRLVEVVSASALCAGSKLVVPGQPDRSLMYVKMTATPTCGASMPLAQPVNNADAAKVRQWIIDLGVP